MRKAQSSSVRRRVDAVDDQSNTAVDYYIEGETRRHNGESLPGNRCRYLISKTIPSLTRR